MHEPADVNGPTVTTDRLLGGRIALVQPRRGFRVAVDPFLLAACVPGDFDGLALDLGCGTGAIALSVAALHPRARLVGIEREPATADLARLSAERSGLSDRVRVVTADIRASSDYAPPGRFDLVLANPPYHSAFTSSAPIDATRSTAHEERHGGLAEFVDAARVALGHRGSFGLIHRADRLPEVLAALAPGFGSIHIVPIWPKRGVAARRTIVFAVKGGAGPAVLHPGLILHEGDGRYTDEADRVLRGEALLAPPGLAVRRQRTRVEELQA